MKGGKTNIRLSSEERRRVILDAAEPLFAKLGFRRTTTAAIARAVGVTEPILYRHFKSKLDLFHVLLREISGDTMREWKRMISNKDSSREKMLAIVGSFPVVGRKFEKHYRVMLAGITELNDPTTKGILRNHYESYVEFLANLLSESDTFRRSGLDSRYAAFHLIHLAAGYALMDPLGISLTQREEYAQHAIQFIGTALAGGTASGGAGK